MGDLRFALEQRGSALIGATPSAGLLIDLLTDDLGSDLAARSIGQGLVQDLKRELASAEAACAAFEDLLAAIDDPAASTRHLEALREEFRGCLQAAGRHAGAIWSDMAGVLRDSAISVAAARHQLDGIQFDAWSLRRETAGLDRIDRIDLCRRLLREPVRPAHHVVWLAYDHARVRWTHWFVSVGPATFYDGPALLGLLKAMEEGEPEPKHLVLPAELMGQVSARMHWPASATDRDRDWVAARVDLGQVALENPVVVARETAESLVGLASFHQGGTTWELLQGFTHVIDGQPGVMSSFGPRHDHKYPESDFTDYELDNLSDELQVVDATPVADLQDFGKIGAFLSGDTEGGATHELAGYVRAVEGIAVKAGQDHWAAFMKEHLALHWARWHVGNALFRAVERAVSDSSLDRMLAEEDLARIYQRLVIHDAARPRGVRLNREVALEELPRLSRVVPIHHAAGRDIATMAVRLDSVGSVVAWVDELVAEYDRQVDRLSRCRNAATHGGPLSTPIATSVRSFGLSQARVSVGISIWGLMKGQSISDAFAELAMTQKEWRRGIASARSVKDALFVEPELAR